jgi:hypothetical protein
MAIGTCFICFPMFWWWRIDCWPHPGNFFKACSWPSNNLPWTWGKMQLTLESMHFMGVKSTVSSNQLCLWAWIPSLRHTKRKIRFTNLFCWSCHTLFELKDNYPVTTGSDITYYFQWLDSQPTHSVLYVLLGCFLSISSKQMDEIVLGWEIVVFDICG